MKRELIDRSVNEAAEEIRKQVRSQVRLWQQIPHWYLESEGRTGWQDDNMPYTSGIWSVTRHYNEPPWIVVECSTGELLARTGSGWRSPTDVEVVALLSKGVEDRLDARSQLEELKRKAAMPRPSWYTDKEWQENEERRQLYRRNFHVTEVYRRPAKPVEFRFNYP